MKCRVCENPVCFPLRRFCGKACYKKSRSERVRRYYHENAEYRRSRLEYAKDYYRKYVKPFNEQFALAQ